MYTYMDVLSEINLIIIIICMCNTYVVVTGFLIVRNKKLSAIALRVHPLPTDRDI